MEPQEYEQKFGAFVDRMNEAMHDIFSEEDHPTVILGLQFGEMGKPDNDLPPCAVTSNLPECLVPEAIEDMMEVAEYLHAQAHGVTVEELRARESMPSMKVSDLSQVPEEIREQMTALAERLGIDPANIEYHETVSTDDLSDPATALHLPEV